MKLRRWIWMTMVMVLLCIPMQALAVPAFPFLTSIEDPMTGETIQGYLRGDEFFAYKVDAQEHVIAVDESGCLRYVIHAGDRYALGGYLIAKNGSTEIGGVPVTGEDEQFQSRLQALLEEIDAARPAPLVPKGEDDYTPLTGHYVYAEQTNDALYGKLKQYGSYPLPAGYAERGATIPLLVIRVNYSDVKGCFTETQWGDMIFNERTGLTAFYLENSNGQFTYRRAMESGGMENDGVVTAELPIVCPRYNSATRALEPCVYHGTDGRDYAIFDVPMLFPYAVAAVEDKVDFASYDTNGDGRIDPTELAIMLVMPGLNASVDGWDQADGQPGAWPHSSIIYSMWQEEGGAEQYEIFRLQVDGVEVYKYTMTVENAGAPATGVAYSDVYNYYTRTGTPLMTPVGTACHELGHDIGLADLYNTSGSSTSKNVNGMSLMALGSWGYRQGEVPGTTPSHIDPYGKMYLGFYDATTVTEDGRYPLAPASDSANYSILKIPTDDSMVYYLVENRQRSGFDDGLLYEMERALRYPQAGRGGLVIWRIDEHVLKDAWNENTVNNTEGKYGIMPLLFKNDPDGDPTYAESERYPFLKDGMLPAALADCSDATTLRAIGRESDWTLLDDAVAAEIEGLPRTPVLPDTGDDAHPLAWLLICLASASGIMLLRRRRRC